MRVAGKSGARLVETHGRLRLSSLQIRLHVPDGSIGHLQLIHCRVQSSGIFSPTVWAHYDAHSNECLVHSFTCDLPTKARSSSASRFSVRLTHLFDQNFDHDYSFKLPLQKAGCPFMYTVFYCTLCPRASCPVHLCRTFILWLLSSAYSVEEIETRG